jgi:conjugal transfer/entry exclusion protein
MAIVILTGCAGQLQQSYQPADMSNFVMNCRQAHYQIEFLSNQIDGYQVYHTTHPITKEDQRYYGKLKNSIWALRSTCDARYL